MTTRVPHTMTAAGGGTVSQTWVQDNDVDDNDQDATTTYYGITLGGGAGNVGAVVRYNVGAKAPT